MRERGVIRTADQIRIGDDGTVFARRVDADMSGPRLQVVATERITLAPGSDLSGVPEEVASVCRKTWTAEVIGAYRASLPPRTKDDLDAEAARLYPKLIALRQKAPTEIAQWVDANVTDFASAKDALKTLAVFACVMARRV